MITKETLFATRRDATPAQKMDLRLDVEVPAGTQLLKCHKMDDRWLITVNLDGKKMQLAHALLRPPTIPRAQTPSR